MILENIPRNYNGVNFSNSCIVILRCVDIYLNEVAGHLYFTLIDLIY